MDEKNSSPMARFNVWQTLRLSSFQIGSAMGDIITTSVWNRIMISELGIPAWPVGLLIALRYLLSPISLWAGHRSDTQTLWGWHRTSYIWLGRGLMVLSFPMLGVSLGRLGTDQGDVVGWLVALFCFLLYGLGTLISGSPFLALVRDTAPKSKQGLAISIVETVLIIMFPVVAIGFGRWMQTYDERVFWEMILVTMGVAGFFWFFAVVRQEKRARAGGVPGRGPTHPSFPSEPSSAASGTIHALASSLSFSPWPPSQPGCKTMCWSHLAATCLSWTWGKPHASPAIGGRSP